MLYPPIQPRSSGLLDVGEGHRLFWEDSGNPRGAAVVVLHGGPGAGCTDISRRWFDPRHYRIVTFAQRGCGGSLPHAGVAGNTPHHLLRDLETLRCALGIRWWMLFGRSWGCALALAYAESHQDRVSAMILNAVFTARREELAWLYGGGAASLAPEAWRAFAGDLARAPDASAILERYYSRLTCGDAAVERDAARAWCAWEDALGWGPLTAPPIEERAAIARARISAHYFVDSAYLETAALIGNAHVLSDIPGLIVQGADDRVTPPITASQLHARWPGSQLQIVPGGGHRSTDPPIMRALIDATDRMAATSRRAS